MSTTRAILLLLAGSCALFAQPSTPQPPTIQVTGRATVSGSPDLAELLIGVSTVAPTAQEAAAQNARDSNALQARLKDTFKLAIEVQTANYSVAPDYEQRPPNEPGVPRRYRVTNMIRVEVKDLSKVSAVIDSSLGSGANRLQGLTFKMKDSRSLERRALQEAAREAQAKANAIAEALGLRITGVRVISESGSGPRPMQVYRAATTVESYAPPIEPGAYETEAQVTLEVTVAQSGSSR